MGNETINVIMVGVGGQGIILASEVLAEVAMKDEAAFRTLVAASKAALEAPAA